MKKVYWIVGIVIIVFIIGILVISFYPSSDKISYNHVNTPCDDLIKLGCEKTSTNSIIVKNYDADKDNQLDPGEKIGECESDKDVANDNLFMLCKCWYGVETDEECKKAVCDCP